MGRDALGRKLAFPEERHDLLFLPAVLQESLVEQLEDVLALPREVVHDHAVVAPVLPVAFVAQSKVLAEGLVDGPDL